MRYVGYERERPLHSLGLPRARGRPAAALPVLVFISLALLVLSRINHDYVDHLRWHVMEWMTPVLSALLVPIEPLRKAGQSLSAVASRSGELERLRAENQQLKGWEWRAKDLERKLESLSTASRTARETAIEFITARVVANSSGAFVRSAMINAGRRHRLRDGYPVVNGDGLVGRIVEVGTNAARVLLLTDVNSRIPVHVGEARVRAILAGDNGPYPRLEFVSEDVEVKPGDAVLTSGTGGFYPRGLRIGTVRSGGPPLRVATHANLDAVEYLGVLLYDNPALDLFGPDSAADNGKRAAERSGKPVAAR